VTHTLGAIINTDANRSWVVQESAEDVVAKIEQARGLPGPTRRSRDHLNHGRAQVSGGSNQSDTSTAENVP
jgi:hypothetical protein